MNQRWHVPFIGDYSADMPLTRSQAYMWEQLKALHGHDQHLNVVGSVALPETVSLQAVVHLLTSAMTKWHTLRLSFPSDIDGQPRQKLAERGTLVVKVRDETEPAARALEEAALSQHLKTGSFDLSTFPLLRCGILKSSEGVVRLILCASHMLVDGVGMQRLTSWCTLQLNPRLRGSSLLPQPSNWQPRDQVKWERSDRGLKAAQTSLNHWKTYLSAAAADDTPPSTNLSVERTRWWRATLISESTTSATSLLAQELGVSPNSVLTAVAALVSRPRDSDEPVAKLLTLVANRFTEPQRSAIGQYSQRAPVRLDLRHRSFRSYLTEAHAKLLACYRYAMFNPLEVAKTIMTYDMQVRQRFALSDSLNCVRLMQQPHALTTRTGTRGLFQEGQLTIEEAFSYEALRTYWHFGSHDHISLTVDTAAMQLPTLTDSLRRLEGILIRAALGDDNLAALIS